MTLPLDSGPKLAVGQWIAWWSGLPGESSSRRKLCILSYHSCHIYRTWKSIYVGGWGGGGGFWSLQMGQVTKGWDHFYGGSWPLKTPCKDFNLAVVGGLGWMKWLKMDREKFIFHAIIPALYPLWWKFCWLSQNTFIFSMLESQSWKNKKVTKMWRLKRLWYLSKRFDHSHGKFQLFQLSCKTVKEFETEI